MGSRVDARDVLDTNGVTSEDFRGRVVGHWQQTGPNSWDPYEYVPDDRGEIDVLSGLKVQVEDWRAELRLRRGGRVVRVEWAPTPDEDRRIAADFDGDRRAAFLALRVRPFDETRGFGARAVIARHLDQ
jgi:hypothetical protein